MKSFEAIAREAYEAFEAQFLHSPTDKVLPWEELRVCVREAWIASARKMAEAIQQVH